MNALPVKTPTPQEIIDDLIADVGIVKVAFVTFVRLFKRTRPPDSTTLSKLNKHHELDLMNDHLRADVGLPPRVDHKVEINLIFLSRYH